MCLIVLSYIINILKYTNTSCSIYYYILINYYLIISNLFQNILGLVLLNNFFPKKKNSNVYRQKNCQYTNNTI